MTYSFKKYSSLFALVGSGTLLVFSFMTFSAYAQDTLVSRDVQFIFTPPSPGPHETVRVDARSFSFDMETALFTWVVDGVTVESEVGKKSITITTGPVGSETRISLTAIPKTGRRVEKSITIFPGSLDLIWSANTYVPPGYQGKPLPTRGSTVTVTAVSNIAAGFGLLSANELFYEWRLNNIIQPQYSGRGRSVFYFTIGTSPNIEHVVSVIVKDASGATTQEKRVTIKPQEPRILFYEINPLRGPQFNNAITDRFSLTSGQEAQFLAVPFFIRTPLSSFTSFWKINTDILPPDESDRDILNYRSDSGSAGKQTISYEIENPSYIFERARNSFIINVQ